MTEVNSLANQLGEPERSQCLNTFTWLISQITEQYLKSSTVASYELFSRFGLTDCGIILLHLYLKALGIDTINFNNLRTL